MPSAGSSLFNPPKNPFQSGVFAMNISVPSQISYLETLKLPFEFGTAVLPKKVAAASNTGGWNWAMAKEAPNPDGAWEWLKFATNTNSLVDWNTKISMLAPRASVRQNTAYQQFTQHEAHWTAVEDTIPTMRIRPKLANYLEWSSDLGKGLQAAINGKATAKDALNTAAALDDQVLAKEPK